MIAPAAEAFWQEIFFQTEVLNQYKRHVSSDWMNVFVLSEADHEFDMKR